MISYASLRRLTTILAALVSVIPLCARAQSPGYAVTKQYKLGGEGFWDYLTFDTTAHRLFITRGTHVEVINPDNGQDVGDIPNTPGAHGVALAPELGRGFVTTSGDSTMHIFDFKTLQPIGTIRTDSGPDGIAYDPTMKYVVSLNGRGHSATVANARTGAVVGNVALPGRPEFPVSDGRGMIYVNIEDKSLVAAINLKTMQVTKQWALAPCESPSGMAMDRAHRRLFSGCHNKVMAVSDPDAGKVIATVPIGQGVDANRFDPGTQLAFSSQGDGTLTVIHEDSPSTFTLRGTVTTQRGARTMALDPQTHIAYVVTADFQPAAQPNERPRPVPGSFTVLVVTPQ
jgi:DNA-binding beta-propeller fold protein YncE